MCSNLILSEAALAILVQKQKAAIEQAHRINQPLAVAANKRMREAYLASVSQKNIHLRGALKNPQAAKIALAMLYLGEGGKGKRSGCLSLGNTSARLIRLYLDLLYICYDINHEKFRARVQHRADQDAAVLLDYWSDVTNIPKSKFYPSYIDERTRNKPTKKLDYKGVCMVYYLSADTFHDLMSAIDILMGR